MEYGSGGTGKPFELYPEVKVIVVAHLYGTPGKIDEIKSIATAHGAVIIEDAAESLGATYKGKQTGCFGDYGCISFNGNKIITGLSGGMFLTDSKGTPRRCASGQRKAGKRLRGISMRNWDTTTA